MLTLERLAFLMESMVHRIDHTHVAHSIYLYERGDFKSINVEWIDEDGDKYGNAIVSIERVDDEGVIHVKAEDGEYYEVEIFERVKSFD